MRQPREGLGYKQPSPVHISRRRASINYITVEDESAASNKPFVFDRLGKSTVRTSVFEKLGPLKKGNKFQRNYQNTKTTALPKIQKISKDFQSLVHSRMNRQIKVMVSCDEVLKVKPYTVVYTKERDEDEESMDSSYNVTAQGEHGILSLMEDDERLDDVLPCYHISFNDGDPQEDEDAKDAPPELEEGVKATIDALKEVNFGTDEKPRPTYLSALLEVDEESTYIELLKEFRDVFAWRYKKMSGLDPKVVVHHLAVKNGALKYPTWVSSIVPVRKKNGQIRVCVDFRDLNNACPKDEFLLPIPELMIDATTGYEAMSFMDGSSGYNQIRMAPKDKELTAFRTPKGIYCYKAIKGQALVDFLADHPIPDDWELTDELPDEDAMVIEVQPPWKMYFNGAAHRRGAGVGVVFVTFQGEVLPYSFTLTQFCSNNVAEYQALILGLEMAVEMKRLQLQVVGDSQLVAKQLLGSYEVNKPELLPYHDYARKLMGWLGDVTIHHVPRKENKKADALAALTSSLTLPDQAQITVCQKWVVPPPNEAESEENELKHLVVVSEVEKEEWRQPIIDYLCYRILPENPRRRTEICRRAPRFLYYKATLYIRSFEGVLLRCLGEEEALQALQEEVKKENVASFIRVNIIYRFGIPRYIITDNGKPFDNRLMNKICELFGFKQRNASMYNAVANGLAKAFNKTLCNLLKKVVSKSKRDWHDRIEEALSAYRTTHRTPTKAAPYALVYGVEVVLPLERQIPSLRLAIQEGKFTSKWDGPYVVHEAYSSGAYKLVDVDGMRIGPINGKFLKKYYP
ncbi:uncharacterized protein [Nicotiana tomentosiformis]|uniref:uncharacterized protein n=1 Tax=Nicotiana tomentosiformis TaxID=4098 RepID=UPI00388CD5BE